MNKEEDGDHEHHHWYGRILLQDSSLSGRRTTVDIFRNTIVRAIVKKVIIPWLSERALVLPAKKRKEISAKLRVDEETLELIEEAIRHQWISNLKQWLEDGRDHL